MPVVQPEGPASHVTGARYPWIAAACALTVAAVYASHLRGATIPVPFFLPLHVVIELSSVVVCSAVFITGWFGYRQSGSKRDLLIGLAFLATGMVDLIHTLSYKGMPDFLAHNTPGTAAAYWLVARMIVGVGLVAASLVNGATKRKATVLWVAVTGTVLLVVASVALITMFSGTVSTALYPREGQPPSPLKVGLEYLIIGTYLAAFLLLSEKREWEPSEIRGLREALVLAIFAEVAFTMYLSPYAWMNGLGHVLKAAAYVLMLNALFASTIRKPYEQLEKTSEKLQALYMDAREHRLEIERSFARIGSALSSSLKLEEALDLVADLAEEMLHVDCSVVASLDKGGRSVRVASQRGMCHKLDRPDEVTLSVGRRVLADRASFVENDIEGSGLVVCDFQDPKCLRSMVCAPMTHEDAVLGVIAIFSYRKNAFEEGDVKLLEGFAAHAAVAVHNALSFEREQRIADALQRSLLSRAEVSVGRFDIAQVYEPAMDEALVGGDFYDVFEAPDGRIVLAIGDVSGKGLNAAVHTAMVKYSLRAYVTEGHSAGAVMGLLNAAVSRFINADTFVTMFVGYLEPETGELTYANAGHEPPLYACADMELTLPPTGAALGIGLDGGYEEGTLVLQPGCVLLLYTDGISEARSSGAMMGLEGIGDELHVCRELGSLDIARCVYRAAIDFGGGELKDDVAILAVRATR